MNQNWIEEVKALRATGSFEKTMARLQEILQNSPNDPQVHYQMAWTHDALGKETDAVPAYEQAIALGLSGADLESAMLGLASTYRCLGRYQDSQNLFEKAIQQYPENGALKALYALTLHNQGQHGKSIEVLLKELVRSSNDKNVQAYQRAILFYADKPDETFE